MIVNLPDTRVVDVTIARDTLFPTRAGFGTLLILVRQDRSIIDPEKPTVFTELAPVKTYSDMLEVSGDWSPEDPAYNAAQTAFSQTPRPLQVKIGYVPATPVESTPEQESIAILSALDAIEAIDNDWYGFTFANLNAVVVAEPPEPEPT